MGTTDLSPLSGWSEEEAPGQRSESPLRTQAAGGVDRERSGRARFAVGATASDPWVVHARASCARHADIAERLGMSRYATHIRVITIVGFYLEQGYGTQVPSPTDAWLATSQKDAAWVKGC